MPKRSTPSRPGSRQANNRKSDQRKRAQKRKKTTNRLRRLESAMVASLPWATGSGLSLPQFRTWPTFSLAAVAGTGWRASKLISLLVLCLAGLLLTWTESNSAFYVYPDSVQFDQLTYLSPDELYARADLEGLSIFWVRPNQVRAAIESHPYVRRAQVSVGLPGRVQIAVDEVSPVALWLTDGGALWLMEDGRALGSRTPTNPALVRIIDGAQDARRHTASGQAGNGTQMDPALLQGALTLSRYLNGLTEFRYAPGPGLYFTLPDTQTLVYWGDGQQTDAKLTTLLSILGTLDNEGQSVQRIDVRFPSKPYYK